MADRERIKEFIELEIVPARRQEREECARTAEEFDGSGADGYEIPTWGEGVSEGVGYAKRGIAAAIRAQGM